MVRMENLTARAFVERGKYVVYLRQKARSAVVKMNIYSYVLQLALIKSICVLTYRLMQLLRCRAYGNTKCAIISIDNAWKI